MTKQKQSESNNKKASRIKVVDTHGHEYELAGSPIGSGGQGQVYRTNIPGVLIKTLNATSDEKQREWLKQIHWVIQQPLEGLPIAKPVAIIDQPSPGYVMVLMDGMIPLSSIMEKAEESMLDGYGLKGFIDSGGVRRRIGILAKLARILADLHGRGLAYGDLSPSNIFVSSEINHFETWLIDADNLCVNSRLSSQRLYTPDYGAPEVLRKESGVNTLTDSWSFGVLAFKFMIMVHPLKGDAVNNGTPEIEEKALRGEFSWIDHPKDTFNSLCEGTGLPRKIVLSAKLLKLFHQCFGDGLSEPGERPSMAAWAEGFESAFNLLVTCEAKDCGSSYIADKNLVCPFCDETKPNDAVIELVHFHFAPEFGVNNGGNEKDVWVKTGHSIILSRGDSVVLKQSPIGTSLYQESKSVCIVDFKESGLFFTPIDSESVHVQKVTSTKEIPRITKCQGLKNDFRKGVERYVLHLGDILKDHPAWLFTW